MGNFIDMAAVLAPESLVTKYLSAHPDSGPAGCVAVSDDRTLILFGDATGDFKRISRISLDLGTTVFALHIHDDDLWMYELYKSGEQIDQFNSIPDYWEEISTEERERWKGNADLIVQNWPGVAKEDIERYLVAHDPAGFNGEEKAYPSDEFESYDAWQVCDFLKKLGTPYPD